jgi:hypothetical protein
LIKIQNILTSAIIISLVLPLQYNTLKFAIGETTMDSTLIMYNDKNSKYPVLADSINTIIKPKVEVSIEGTPNDDQLKGGEGDDKINGEDGDDTISGKEGNDKINGGKNDDIINGESGNDTLKGENGDDKLSGESGNDLIEGGKGDDTLLAGEGDEGILGNEGNDVLNGGKGVDIMAGGTGNDTFICDLFDTIIDFNLTEGDKIIGQCSSLDQTDFEKPFHNTSQEDFESGSPSSVAQQIPRFDNPIQVEDFQAASPPPSFHPNNISSEEFKLPPQPQPQPKVQPPPSTQDDYHTEDFGSVPPIPVPPPKEVFIAGPYFK